MPVCSCSKIFIILIITFTRIRIHGIPNHTDIDCSLTKVWGPGLKPESIITPARYFFLQTFHKNGNVLTESPGNDIFRVQIGGREKECRIKTEILDRHDGSFVVRYKLYSPCSHLQISIECSALDSSTSYHFKSENIVYPSECACQIENNLEDWIRRYSPQESSYDQIESNLKYFQNIDVHRVFHAVQENLLQGTRQHCICNYVIKNNEIYRKCYGPYTGFKMFMDSILLLLSRQVRLPDVEFFINLGDWPLIKDKVDYRGRKILVPIFSWCGSHDTYDIILPTYDLTEASIENMGRVTLDILSVQANSDPPWNDKISKLFWRGRDANRERLKLIGIARQNSHLINASLTNFFFYKDLEHLYGPAEPRVSFFKFFQYKYQLNLDGTVAAYRFPYLLAGNALVFKQDSPFYEYFYQGLKEWIHYVPVKRDLSNLLERLQWAIDHDDQARQIAKNGQKFANEFLLPHHVFGYHLHLLNAYSRKLNTTRIEIRSGMEKVEYDDQNVECECPPDTTTDSNPKSEREEL